MLEEEVLVFKHIWRSQKST